MAKLQDCLVAALEARGAQRTTKTSTKYTVLANPRREGHFFFVGKAGGLRCGQTIASSHSVPVLRNVLLGGVS